MLISDEVGKLAMEGQRSVLTLQIAGFAAMLVGNSTVGEERAAVFEYERSNGKEWQERLREMSKRSSKRLSTSSSLEEATHASLQITSPVLFNTSFLLSQQKVASVLKGLNSLLISLNSILLVGSDSAPPSGDDAIDSMTASRSQGVNHDVETLLNSKVKCLMLNEALCKEGRIAGMTDEFYGLNALLLLFIDNVQTLTNAKDEELVPTNPSFQFITTASKFDLGDGIKMAELLREKYIKGVVNVIPSLVIVLFIIFLIVMLMVFALCFSPLPRILRGVQSKTMYIEHLATSAEEEQIVWSEELVTQVGRMDEAHHVLVNTLAAIVALVAQHAPLAEVAQAGDKLLAVAMIHFADEEQMMEATHYPAQVQNRHCQAHVELLGSALAFVAGIEAGEAPLSDVVAFCSMWIMSHIRTADQQLAIYLLRTFDAKRLAQPVPFDRLVLPPSWKAHMRSGALSQKDREQLRCTVKRMKEKEERGESIC
ncbi:uncharacterized protein MONOS_6372 [Monocercomonoides exilis]|uniref:uncharacterized protein n=1 Tax=Monocercomonoides exilis TaxID=2049356 RepID=UPI00355A20B8|nr:hypothetical protein MONOS_6372 [Monocercomonoides exilis]|eukprot:MONOS_6372.1-p1 / transcript=MONOS_6372.1 / gene=MONOS_6372 / organism=Monocercomonoides_exilis_PA203 / gene_product=unspecified product / transcript_product=unspecified product / location=Mono_scaffold00200:8265-9713(+) / protein_length=482 / sequence_SO=supercontig / SO=protein_coding / is_pseudo=false